MSYTANGRIDFAVIHAGTNMYSDGPLSAASLDSTPIGQTTPAAGAFTTLSSTSPLFSSVDATGNTATPSPTRTTSTLLTGQMNIINVCATSGNGVRLPNMVGGTWVVVFNQGAQPAAVYPYGGTTTIDGGTPGNPVTLTNAEAAIFWCLVTGTIITTQLGAPSA